MKKYFMMLCVVILFAVNIATAAINLSGTAEISYDADSKAFTAESSEIVYSAEVKKGINAEIVWSDNALDSYFLSYEKSGLVISGGLMGVPFGQYYSHLISDSQFKDAFDPTQPGLMANYKYYMLTISGGVFNNTATTGSKQGEADLTALTLSFDVVDGVVVGAGYMKDSEEDPVSNLFCEAVVDKYTIDGEYGVKDKDIYLSIGVAYQLQEDLEIAARGESIDLDATGDYTVAAVGLNYMVEKDLTLSLEYYNKDEDQNVMAKASLEF